MAIRPYSPFGGDGGAGFALGTANNIFGTDSGDTDLTTITIASSRAVAEATRDAYDTATSGWLANYTDLDVNIILFYTDGTRMLAQYQRRVGSSWVDSGPPVIAIQGDPGSATDFSGVGSYELLMPGASPDFTPIAAGARRLNNGTGDFEFDATVIVPQESLQIGFGGVLSALGAIPLFRSFVTGRRGTFPFTYYDKTTGTSRTVELSAASNSRDESQSDDTDTVTTGSTFPLTTTAAEIISGIIVRPDDGVTVGGLRFRMTIQGQTDPFYYWPSRTLWDNNVGQDIVGDGSANNDYLVDLINAPLFLLGIADPDDPVTLNIEFEFTSGSFKGNASGVPYIAVDRNIVTLRELAYVSELPDVAESVDLSVSGDDLTITVGRTGTATDLTDTVALPSGGGGTSDGVVDSSTIAVDENNNITLTLGRTESLSDLTSSFQIIAGNDITLTPDITNGTITISSGTTPGADEEFYHGLSDSSNAATILLTALTQEDVGTGTGQQFTFASGTATASQYLILLVPAAHDVISIVNTGTNINETASFTRTENVRQISSENYHSYVLGPLVAGFNASYRVTLA